MQDKPVETLLDLSLQARARHLEDFPQRDEPEGFPFDGAYRLFNGFLEGYPDLAVDLYGRTLVLHNYARDPQAAQLVLERAGCAHDFPGCRP